jgi:hypothetical protein
VFKARKAGSWRNNVGENGTSGRNQGIDIDAITTGRASYTLVY